MATFIPERSGSINARTLAIKRALNALDDRFIVRTSLRTENWAPDYFIEHPELGWAFVNVVEGNYSTFTVQSMLATTPAQNLTSYLQHITAVDVTLSPVCSLKKFAIGWEMTAEEAQRLTQEHGKLVNVVFLGKELFLKHAADLIPKALIKPHATTIESLRLIYFPEAEISNNQTTRRHFYRNSSAQLPRFFLDPQQEWASKLDLNLPNEQAEASKDFSVRLINGVAGSGKTLIAINRALLLAQMYPEKELLILIHNTPVVADIRHRLLHANRLPKNVTIQTFSSWMLSQWHRVMPNRAKATKLEASIKWVKEFRTKWPSLKQTDAQLDSELAFINEALIANEDAYLGASRIGRGFSLRVEERQHIWQLYETVTAGMAKARACMWSMPPREIVLATESHVALKKYEHILIDEAQFFAPSWFELVKLSRTEGGQLFLCADPNQGFMKSRLSWKSAGLDVRGRTKKLRYSYRTTKAILSAANSLLTQFSSDDPEEYLTPELEDMHDGFPPELVYCDSPQDAADRVVAEVIAMANQVNLSIDDILVIYGDNVSKSMLFSQLENALPANSVWWFNKDKKDPPYGHERTYLRLANIDTATGLEAAVVFLIGVENLLFASGSPFLNEEERREIQIEHFRKLYMAMTRAGQRLILLSTAKLPTSIEALFTARA